MNNRVFSNSTPKCRFIISVLFKNAFVKVKKLLLIRIINKANTLDNYSSILDNKLHYKQTSRQNNMYQTAETASSCLLIIRPGTFSVSNNVSGGKRCG